MRTNFSSRDLQALPLVQLFQCRVLVAPGKTLFPSQVLQLLGLPLVRTVGVGQDVGHGYCRDLAGDEDLGRRFVAVRRCFHHHVVAFDRHFHRHRFR